ATPAALGLTPIVDDTPVDDHAPVLDDGPGDETPDARPEPVILPFEETVVRSENGHGPRDHGLPPMPSREPGATMLPAPPPPPPIIAAPPPPAPAAPAPAPLAPV